MLMAKYVNFTFELTVVPENIRWGEIYRNGSATGAFNLVTHFFIFLKSRHFCLLNFNNFSLIDS